MDSDDFRCWSVIAAVFATICTLAIGDHWISCRHRENMARLGYEQEPMLGSDRLVWKRCTPPPPKAEPKWDLTPVQPAAPEDIIKYITTNAPPSLYDLVSVTQEQLNAWTNVQQKVVCPRCGQELNWSEPLRCYIGVVTDRMREAK